MALNTQLHLFEQLMSCTVRVSSTVNRQVTGSGTSFLMQLAEKDGRHITALITNKHVVQDAEGISFVLSHSLVDGSDVQHAVIEMPLGEQDVINHPDPDIDLCAIYIGWALNGLREQQRFIHHIIIGDDICATAEIFSELLPLESVVMIGYPNGLWDEVNNGAIARHGALASNPGSHFNGKPDFVVDMACFPGSSGSPIFLLDKGSYSDRNGNTVLGGRCALLGILHSGPTARVDGSIEVRPVPTSQVPFAKIQMMINLGYAVKITELAPIREIAMAKIEQEAKAS